jgi:hypothetical protein
VDRAFTIIKRAANGAGGAGAGGAVEAIERVRASIAVSLKRAGLPPGDLALAEATLHRAAIAVQRRHAYYVSNEAAVRRSLAASTAVHRV